MVVREHEPQFGRLGMTVSLLPSAENDTEVCFFELVECLKRGNRFQRIMTVGELAALALLAAATVFASPSVAESWLSPTALAEVLHDPDQELCQYAAWAMVFFAVPAIIPALREACAHQPRILQAFGK